MPRAGSEASGSEYGEEGEEESEERSASVRERRELVLPGTAPERVEPNEGPLALLCAEARLGFRSTVVPLDDEDAPIVSKECREALGVAGGDRVHVTPLP